MAISSYFKLFPTPRFQEMETREEMNQFSSDALMLKALSSSVIWRSLEQLLVALSGCASPRERREPFWTLCTFHLVQAEM